MNKDVNYVPLSKLLKEIKREEIIEGDKTYEVLGARWYAKGLYVKYIKKGSEIKAKKMYLVKKGDFVYSRLFAWKGSFALADGNVDNCYVSNEFPCFEINDSLVIPEYLRYIFFDEARWNQSLEFSEGSTAVSRNRLKVDKFLNFKIPLPSLEEQKDIVGKLSSSFSIMEKLTFERDKTTNDVQGLRNKILQLAIQGKLVEQDPNDEPASIVLEKIKKEKDQLVKEKKIKKEKSLPLITTEEIPFELPNGWEWTRIGDITTIKGGKRLPPGYQLTETPTQHIYIRVSDMKNNTIVDNDLRYITDEVYRKIGNYIIKKEDLYITIVGSTIGKVGMIPDKFDSANLTENAARIILHIANKEFLLYVLNSKFIQEQFVNKTKQVGQPKLALSRLKSTLIPLPPLNEQKRIVEKLNQLMTLCDELERNIEESKLENEKLLKAVLQEAFAVKEEALN